MTDRKECCSELWALCSPELFKALSDPNRVAILVRLALCGSEQTVKEVASCCPVDLSGVSRHLRTLRDAGIVEADRRGKEVFHRVRTRELADLLRRLADAIESCCPERAEGGD